MNIVQAYNAVIVVPAFARSNLAVEIRFPVSEGRPAHRTFYIILALSLLHVQYYALSMKNVAAGNGLDNTWCARSLLVFFLLPLPRKFFVFLALAPRIHYLLLPDQKLGLAFLFFQMPKLI